MDPTAPPPDPADVAPSRRRVALHAALLTAPLLALAVAGTLRRWTSDDGFINVRVVENILRGDGPVFNIGERVEAVTSPAWIAVLTLVGALRLPVAPTSAWVGIAFGVAGAALALRGSLDLARCPTPLPEGAARRAFVPFGLVAFAALPAVWDFLSSGLENGLSYLWIGATLARVARLARRADDDPARVVPLRDTALTGLLAGVGPTVRPDLAVAAGLFGLVLLALTLRGRPLRAHPASVAALAGATAAVPVGYQVFRMGYYATVSPNTALAKEAFFANWPQGILYADNYATTYRLFFPLALVALVALRELGRTAAARRWMSLGVAAASVVSGVVCGVYVVRVGGDFMHARMLLPATFLLLAPVSAVALRGDDARPLRVSHALAAGLLTVWAVVCAAALRMTVENQHHIGDERGWYVRGSGRRFPTDVPDYTPFFFHVEGTQLAAAARERCPDHTLPPWGAPVAACDRRVYFDQHEYGGTWEAGLRPQLDPAAVHPGAVMVAARHAIGMIGLLVGPRVHLVDRAGLADPIASRLELTSRGRPGHEKTLYNTWIQARFGLPAPDDDPAVVAARHALRCGDAVVLDRALREPMSLRRFVENLRLARRLSQLRFPQDPFVAEERLCPTARRAEGVAGGDTGRPYRLECPTGSAVVALRVTTAPAGPATVAHVAVECRDVNVQGQTPAIGAERAVLEAGVRGRDERRITCAEGELPVGLHGGAGDLVDRVGLVCARATLSGRAVTWTSPRDGDAGGGAQGAPWRLPCREGAVLVGLAGRAGALVDAVGPVCGSLDGSPVP